MSLPTTTRNITVVPGRFPRISWGAILAGTVVTLSLGWLMHLLGMALGVSLADYTDSVTIEGGIDEGAAIWMIVCWLIAFFVGAMVAARLAGLIDDFNGMLHGLTLWGVASLVMTVLTFYGLSTLMSAGQAAISTAASGVSAAAEGLGSAASGLGQATRRALDTEFAADLQDRLTDRAIEMTADLDPQLSEQELRQAINGLDQRTIRRMTRDLMDDDSESAAEILAGATNLSEQDARALVDGVYREAEEQFGNPDNQQSLMQDLQNQLARQVDSYVAELDAQGGPQVDQQDIRQAIRELDATAMRQLAQRVASGDGEGAKQVLARHTNLTTAQIDDLYQGVAQDWEQQVESYQEELDEWMETVGDYTQALLWTAFGGSAAALVVSLLGGWLGAHSSREMYEERIEEALSPRTVET